MNGYQLALTILGAGAVTFALRWSFIGLIDRIVMPGLVRRALDFVPAAVLAALVFPSVLVGADGVNVAPDNLRLIAALIAAIAAWATRSIFYTIATGMLALWLLTALAGR